MSHRVLVLEADPDLRILVAMTLRNAGYECELANGDGLGALHDAPGARRRRPPPAAIVLGLPPERAAGITLSGAAKAAWPGVPLVVLVSDPSSRLRDGYLAAGAGAVLCHPLDLHALAEAIERLLGDGPAAPAQSLSAEVGRPADVKADPAALPSDGPRRDLSSLTASRRAEEGPPMPKRILVVEDDAATARVVETVLAAHGYHVMHADTLAAARLRLATAVAPRLAVLDVALPDGDGIEFCHELKATWPALPVLLTSERLSAGACADARATGCVALMPKPFDLDTLVLAIRIGVGDVADRRRLPRENATWGAHRAA